VRAAAVILRPVPLICLAQPIEQSGADFMGYERRAFARRLVSFETMPVVRKPETRQRLGAESRNSTRPSVRWRSPTFLKRTGMMLTVRPRAGVVGQDETRGWRGSMHSYTAVNRNHFLSG
jgi:hypothetical protein